jgi:hypothetical protein
MFAFTHTEVSCGTSIRKAKPSIPAMPFPEGITALQERILLSLWKLRGIGKNAVKEETLRADLSPSQLNKWTDDAKNLQNQGFIEATSGNGQNLLSLTALGLSILRKIEEDRLQELK